MLTLALKPAIPLMSTCRILRDGINRKLPLTPCMQPVNDLAICVCGQLSTEFVCLCVCVHTLVPKRGRAMIMIVLPYHLFAATHLAVWEGNGHDQLEPNLAQWSALSDQSLMDEVATSVFDM